ncbi:MAG: hypothetical protein VB106_10285 [Clostridiaceae bacterium]|nr:hypothetical protein [Clostridiaceae bacterium]
MEDKAFELMEKLYTQFTDFRKETRDRFDAIDKKLTFIEQDHGKKLGALFDGYKQHSDQLDRIEELVSKHDDIIIRKVK